MLYQASSYEGEGVQGRDKSHLSFLLPVSLQKMFILRSCCDLVDKFHLYAKQGVLRPIFCSYSQRDEPLTLCMLGFFWSVNFFKINLKSGPAFSLA